MELQFDYMAKKKKAQRRVGRPSREDLGLEALVTVFTQVEGSVKDAILKKHGTIAACLRWAAKENAPTN